MGKRDEVDQPLVSVFIDKAVGYDDISLGSLFNEFAVAAGWSGDPADGDAFLLSDGREVLSPLKFAPPVGFRTDGSVSQMINDMVKKELALMKGNEVVDDAEDLDDYPEDDAPIPVTQYEFVMRDDYPGRNVNDGRGVASAAVKPGVAPVGEGSSPGIADGSSGGVVAVPVGGESGKS